MITIQAQRAADVIYTNDVYEVPAPISQQTRASKQVIKAADVVRADENLADVQNTVDAAEDDDAHLIKPVKKTVC